MRPVLMTCIIAGVGLLPAAMSTGIGSQVQKPLAIVVIGGMMLAPVVILITLPVLIVLFSRRTGKHSNSMERRRDRIDEPSPAE
jgi:cobalt-zinc-cadmium resistance protein CzcA